MDAVEKDINFSNHPDLLLVVDTVAREKALKKRRFLMPWNKLSKKLAALNMDMSMISEQKLTESQAKSS